MASKSDKLTVGCSTEIWPWEHQRHERDDISVKISHSGGVEEVLLTTSGWGHHGYGTKFTDEQHKIGFRFTHQLRAESSSAG